MRTHSNASVIRPDGLYERAGVERLKARVNNKCVIA